MYIIEADNIIRVNRLLYDSPITIEVIQAAGDCKDTEEKAEFKRLFLFCTFKYL